MNESQFNMNDFLNLTRNNKVIVFGDMALDINTIGSFVGQSREIHSISIFAAESYTTNPGGGGNLASNFRSLQLFTSVCGQWGRQDEMYRRELERLFNEVNISTLHMIDSERTGVFGKHYFTNGTHRVRTDVLFPKVYVHTASSLLNALKHAINNVNPNAIVFADYDEFGYGMCSKEILNAAHIQYVGKDNFLLFATSRKRIKIFKNFDYLVVNGFELRQQIYPGDNEIDDHDRARRLIEITGAKYVIVTLAGIGANIFPAGEETQYVPSIPLTDVDTCGCGDTFLAAFASAIMVGLDAVFAVRIGHAAASSVARKQFGAAILEPNRVDEEYQNMSKMHS